MDERAAIEHVIRSAYAARLRGDLDALMTYFHPDSLFQLVIGGDLAAMGEPQVGHVAVRAQLGGLITSFHFANFQSVELIVEGGRVAHVWCADVTARESGRTESFEAVDLIGIEDGLIRSFKQFTDTASVVRLLGP